MSNLSTATRLATSSDVENIVNISCKVQDALMASGSLQQIGPLIHSNVALAVVEGRCFVTTDSPGRVIGCAMVQEVDESYLPSGIGFNITDYPKPWQYVHSVMLIPEFQGKGIGLRFFNDMVKVIEPRGGTIVLDCWAGNDKLINFYAQAGCKYVATLPEEDYEVAVLVRWLGDGCGISQT